MKYMVKLKHERKRKVSIPYRYSMKYALLFHFAIAFYVSIPYRYSMKPFVLEFFATFIT